MAFFLCGMVCEPAKFGISSGEGRQGFVKVADGNANAHTVRLKKNKLKMIC